MFIEIIIDDDTFLSQPNEEDITDLVKHLNEKEIYQNTLTIPYPYSKEDAKYWLKLMSEFEIQNGVQKFWSIRHKREGLIGGIGLHFPDGIESHKNEIGYWLAKPFWKKGIMTKVIAKFTEYCFNTYHYKRIEAPIFSFNTGSERVLIKNGFKFEGLLKNYDLKDGKLIDIKMYAKIK